MIPRVEYVVNAILLGLIVIFGGAGIVVGAVEALRRFL